MLILLLGSQNNPKDGRVAPLQAEKLRRARLARPLSEQVVNLDGKQRSGGIQITLLLSKLRE